MKEANRCPRPGCGKPEAAKRRQSGQTVSICGNGHSWSASGRTEKAKEADRAEGDTLKQLQRDVDQINRDMWGPTGRPPKR